MTYLPKPIQTEDIPLGDDILALSELLARNAHDVWARERMKQGWVYGPVRDDGKKEHPCLLPYEALPESEKEYDRKTAMETLKVIVSLGYEIRKAPAGREERTGG